MKRTPLLLLGIALLLSLAATARAGSALTWQARVDPSLLAQMTRSDTVQPISFLVVLSEQADVSAAGQLSTKEAKAAYVYDRLRETATRSQEPLLTLLDDQDSRYQRFWIRNMVLVYGDRSHLRSVALMPGVGRIYANTSVRHDAPLPTTDQRSLTAPDDLLWNLTQINAPDLWAMGITGQGVVIGGQDTGYDWTHPALLPTYRGWDGATADHNRNWHDAIHEENPLSSGGNVCGYDSPEPCDDQTHGTHTMGTMAGGDTPDDEPVGVAPGASWIGCRNMEDGWGTPATYAECFEWFVAPYPLGGDPFTDGDPTLAPHVINNSWSCPPSEGCTTQTVLQDVVETVRAAGILTVQSAGNSGSSCGSVTTPAAVYDASYTVGATDLIDSIDTIASFSSRGPTPDGLLKPDISAPGVGIRSSIRGGDYGLLSGTSMAAPHVAGAAALLISAQPSLAGDVEAIEALLNQSALPLPATQSCGDLAADQVPNHVYGWGRLDVLAAYGRLVPTGQRLFVPLVTNR